jgi:rhamnosyltransferase
MSNSRQDLALDAGRVLAIVVTFNPRQDELKTLLPTLAIEGVETVVIDNASHEADAIGHLVASAPRTRLVRLTDNYGIAAAQNIGLRQAVEEGFEYALLFDQDSLPRAGFVQRSLETFRQLDPEGRSVAAVAPTYVDRSTGFEYPFVRFSRIGVHTFRPTEAHCDISLLIASGSMIRVGLLPSIGLMNEALFIDHVDTDWCLRAVAAGYRLIGLRDNTIEHSVGDETIRVLGRHLPAHNHRRRYFGTRNLFYLIRHARAPLQWKLKESVTSVLKLGLLLPSLERPTAHMRAYVRGVYDGIRGNLGRAPR